VSSKTGVTAEVLAPKAVQFTQQPENEVVQGALAAAKAELEKNAKVRQGERARSCTECLPARTVPGNRRCLCDLSQTGRTFDAFYTASKLIGHGAFAKVCICTHHETKEKLAVKTVQKNLEDPQKQRDGARQVPAPLVPTSL
jgi:hypothetical protein